MIDRCTNDKHPSWKNYGGRGIIVCDDWINNPTLFLNWYGKNYFPKGQVDRINNDGNYSPDNCRIVSAKQNSRNRRNTRFLTVFGETKSFGEWCEDPRSSDRLNIGALVTRIKQGWNGIDAITLPISRIPGQAPDAPNIQAFNESKTLHEWTLDSRCVVSKRTLWYRLNAGWDSKEAITKNEAKNAGIKYDGKSVLQWSKDPSCEVSYKILMSRLKNGIDLQEALRKDTNDARMM